MNSFKNTQTSVVIKNKSLWLKKIPFQSSNQAIMNQTVDQIKTTVMTISAYL